MIQEKGSEGFENLKRSINDQDLSIEEKKLPFKKRAYFLYSNLIKEMTQSENSGANDDDQRISFTSGLTNGTEEITTNIIPLEKRSSHTIYPKDDHVASLSQMATSESGDKLSLLTSADDEGDVEKTAGEENLVLEHVVSTRIHEPQGGGYTNDSESNVVSQRKQADKTKEVIEHGGGCSPTDTAGGRSDNSEAAHQPVQLLADKDGGDGSGINSGRGEEEQPNEAEKPSFNSELGEDQRKEDEKPDVLEDGIQVLMEEGGDGMKRSRSSRELVEQAQDGGGADESGQQGRKKFKYESDGNIEISSARGPDGGIGCGEPLPAQQANHTFRLIGTDTPNNHPKIPSQPQIRKSIRIRKKNQDPSFIYG